MQADLEETWRRKSDDELMEAAAGLGNYTELGESIIRAELRRRGLAEPPPTVRQVNAPTNPARFYVPPPPLTRVLGIAVIVLSAIGIMRVFPFQHTGDLYIFLALAVAIGSAAKDMVIGERLSHVLLRLRSPKHKQRKMALKILKRLPEPNAHVAIPAILEAAKDQVEAVRVQAFQTLAKITSQPFGQDEAAWRQWWLSCGPAQ
jgi:hypothetical protein